MFGLLAGLAPGQPVAAATVPEPPPPAIHPAKQPARQPAVQLLTAVQVVSVHAQSALPPLTFREPVDAAVNDGWRPPSNPYGAGNRGWQYATVDGEVVRSAGGGTVTFAGQVGGVGAVTVTHRGGLRTSYTRLASIDVRAGHVVIVGERLGAAMIDLHFGVRIRDTYIDPGLLFRPGALRYGAQLRPT